MVLGLSLLSSMVCMCFRREAIDSPLLSGHGFTSEAVNLVFEVLPSMLRESLAIELKGDSHAHLDDSVVARVLTEVIATVDNRIGHDLTSLLDLTDGLDTGIRSRVEALRAESGTTCTIALIDPSRAIHVGNVGDSDACQSSFHSLLPSSS